MKEERRAIVEILNKRSDVLFATLFGSNVKGYAYEGSDWDIAIYFKIIIHSRFSQSRPALSRQSTPKCVSKNPLNFSRSCFHAGR